MIVHIPPTKFLWIAAMSNGEGFDVKVPWWVNAVAVLGVTAVIALYMVYWVTTTVTVQLTTINTIVTRQADQSAVILKAVADSQNDPVVVAFRRLQLRFALQECINSAKSPVQTRDCVDIGKYGGVNVE